jgi:type I restriction enzyme S subunit
VTVLAAGEYKTERRGLGETPTYSGGWLRVRLGDHATKVGSGFTPYGGHAAYVQEGIPLIRSQNIHIGRFEPSGLVHISPVQDAEMVGSRVQRGDILFNITGASIGRVCVVPDHVLPANVNQHVCIIRSDGSWLPNYLCRFLSAPDFQRFILGDQAGATRQALTKVQIEDFEIPLPPLPEQERLAGRLTEQLAAVERARAAARSRLAAAEALSAAYLRDAFEGAEWPVMELGEGLTRFEAGTSVVALGRPAEEGEWGVLKVSAVSWGQFNARENKAVPAGYVPPTHERVRSGDLIISRANTAELAGAIVLVRDTPNNLMLSDKTLRLVLKQNVFAPEFLELALRSRAARKFIEANATGTSHSMRNISQPTMRAIPVSTPPLATQPP